MLLLRSLWSAIKFHKSHQLPLNNISKKQQFIKVVVRERISPPPSQGGWNKWGINSPYPKPCKKLITLCLWNIKIYCWDGELGTQLLPNTEVSLLCLESYWNKAPVHKHLVVNCHTATINFISTFSLQTNLQFLLQQDNWPSI